MARLSYNLLSLLVVTLLFSSCMKKEKPLKVPEVPQQSGDFEIKNSQVTMGEDYQTQFFFSFDGGVVLSNKVTEWDINLTNGTEKNEIRMNGGKKVFIYPSANNNFAAVTSIASVAETAWKYDDPSDLPGTSGLGYLDVNNHIGEVLVVDNGEGSYYKLQILEDNNTGYKVNVGPLAATAGEEQIWTKDTEYNYTYFSFASGLVKPEPPKKDWDVAFTRYRHIYFGYNPDGSDFLYQVTGVLSNPYLTTVGKDTVNTYNFYDFTLEDAEKYTLFADRNVIGFDWKTVNINTGSYTVNPKSIFVIKDQKGAYWKLHFVSFYGDDGAKGSPRFEYQRVK